MRFPKYQLRRQAEKIAEALNVRLDPDASKDELANWLSIMEPHYEEWRRTTLRNGLES
jgi:hypothetical protein